MSKKRTSQCSPDLPYRDHAIYDELSSLSQWLDAHPQITDQVFDLLKGRVDSIMKRLSMRKIHEVLRLEFEHQPGERKIANVRYAARDSEQADNRVLRLCFIAPFHAAGKLVFSLLYDCLIMSLQPLAIKNLR